MSTCLVCQKEIAVGESMRDDKPAICGWVPPGASKSVYAIVIAHLMCMSVDQLRQALKSWEEETRRRGYPAIIVSEVEKRLSYLLAGGARESAPSGSSEGSRWSLLEVD